MGGIMKLKEPGGVHVQSCSLRDYSRRAAALETQRFSRTAPRLRRRKMRKEHATTLAFFAIMGSDGALAMRSQPRISQRECLVATAQGYKWAGPLDGVNWVGLGRCVLWARKLGHTGSDMLVYFQRRSAHIGCSKSAGLGHTFSRVYVGPIMAHAGRAL